MKKRVITAIVEQFLQKNEHHLVFVLKLLLNCEDNKQLLDEVFVISRIIKVEVYKSAAHNSIDKKFYALDNMRKIFKKA